MSQTDTPSDKSTIACGLLTLAMGVFLVLQTSGIVSVGDRSGAEAPAWIGVCAGLIFVAGGIAVVLQSLPFAKFAAGGRFSADTPIWVRSITLALMLTIVGGMAAIGGWVAFGPGPRHFHFVGMFIGSDRLDDAIGRAIFGVGTVLSGLIFVVFAVLGMRQVGDRSRR
jgi:hypothetical protein